MGLHCSQILLPAHHILILLSPCVPFWVDSGSILPENGHITTIEAENHYQCKLKLQQNHVWMFVWNVWVHLRNDCWIAPIYIVHFIFSCNFGPSLNIYCPLYSVLVWIHALLDNCISCHICLPCSCLCNWSSIVLIFYWVLMCNT